jgi:DNA-binding CsgD family transcriptional regulator
MTEPEHPGLDPGDRTHVARILAKLELRDRVHAVIVAHQAGFLP